MQEYVIGKYCISLYIGLLFFITINILVYNMDHWKQQKPFHLADNKASLVWIP